MLGIGPYLYVADGGARRHFLEGRDSPTGRSDARGRRGCHAGRVRRPLAWTIYRDRWHLHTHEHDGAHHVHLHRHQEQDDHHHPHWMRLSVRPLCIGMVHGLAGSAALLLIVLSTVQTLGQGILYITVFGIGSIIGMVLIGLLVSIPLVLSATYGGRARKL